LEEGEEKKGREKQRPYYYYYYWIIDKRTRFLYIEIFMKWLH